MQVKNERAAPADTGSGSQNAHLGGKSEPKNIPDCTGAQVLVFLHGRRIGAVVARSAGWDAITSAGNGLGRFNTIRAAAWAVLSGVVRA